MSKSYDIDGAPDEPRRRAVVDESGRQTGVKASSPADDSTGGCGYCDHAESLHMENMCAGLDGEHCDCMGYL